MRNAVQTGVVSICILGLVGCSSLPGSDEQQGAVIGGASGAAVGAAVSKKNRALGAVIGGAVGAAGGYVIGKNKDKITGRDNDDNDNDVETAAERAQQSPATPEAARAATTADVNSDGFVTLDEVVALEQANLTDDQIMEKLRATNQVFDLTEEQRRYLLDRGVSQSVVSQLETLNQTGTSTVPNDPVISGSRSGSSI